jgi:hypothetical protein
MGEACQASKPAGDFRSVLTAQGGLPHLGIARHSLRNCLLELRKALRGDAVKILITDFVDCRADMSVTRAATRAIKLS